MRLLLDTHALLWWLADDPKLGSGARDLIANPSNDVLVSVAVLWEIQVKVRIGKLRVDMADTLAEMQRQGFDLLAITPAHLLTLGTLPRHHRDPWDHLLIAQAVAEEAIFMSEDTHTAAYPVLYVTCSGPALALLGGGLSPQAP